MTTQRKATQISTAMWDKLLHAARVMYNPLDYRATAIRIGANEGWTEEQLMKVGIIEELTEAEQHGFNLCYREHPWLSASKLREFPRTAAEARALSTGQREPPRNNPTKEIIEHVHEQTLEPWAREGRTPTTEEERAFNQTHGVDKHGIAKEKKPEGGKEQPGRRPPEDATDDPNNTTGGGR